MTDAAGKTNEELLKELEALRKRIFELETLEGQHRKLHEQIGGIQEDLFRTATTDQLTGVLNRQYFEDILGREILKVRRYDTIVSVLLLDLDGFEKINRKYGYAAGDSLLKLVARIIDGYIRTSDSLARWDGDSFAILAPVDGEHSMQLAEKLKDLIAEHEVPAACNLRSSVGVTQIEADDTVETAMGRVTDALIKAKLRGKDTTDIL
jgi:diguanylate cyclase (GGDEF)-like protein